MDIVKYFYEEPVHLEALSAETDPDARRRAAPERSLADLLTPTAYYRGYLAGSRGDRVGLTVLDAEAFVPALLDVLGGPRWTQASRSGETSEAADPTAVLRGLADVGALAESRKPVKTDDLKTVAAVERRVGIPALRRLLDAGATVLFPEPAHEGWDWSLFAARPIRGRLVAAFRAHPVEGVRRFALPYPKARSEHTFYFERWALGALPEWVEEL